MNLEHLAPINVTQAARLDPATSGYGSGVWTANTTETTKQAGALNASPYVWELMGKASKLYGVVTSYEPTPSAQGDLGAYIRAGLPSAQLISSEVYYHSSGDTPSTISVPGLERAAAFYAGFIEDVAKTPREKLKVTAPWPSSRPAGSRLAPVTRLDHRHLPRRRRMGCVHDALAGVDHGVLSQTEDVLVVRTSTGQALVEIELGHPQARRGSPRPRSLRLRAFASPLPRTDSAASATPRATTRAGQARSASTLGQLFDLQLGRRRAGSVRKPQWRCASPC